MDKKASEVLGESVIAGVRLEAKEAVKSKVGRVIGEVLTSAEPKPASLPGDYEGIHYVAVGPTKMGFFSIKRGFFRNSLGELLVEHLRSDLQEMEIGGGIMPAVHFLFRDGTHYVLVCPRIKLGKVKKIREMLTSGQAD